MLLNVNPQTPSLPNYILTDQGPVHISKFSERQLRVIANDWVEKLIHKSKTTRDVRED